jgi:hypothetical protein
MKNGINQSGRQLAALDPSYVVLDERSLLEMVQFTLNYAEAVSYHNFQNKPVGNWKHFLLNDPVFIVGLIAATSLDSYKLRQEELEVGLKESDGSSAKNKEELAQNLLALIQNLIYWENLFQSCRYTGPLFKEILNGIKYLEPMILLVLPLQKKFSTADFVGMGLQKSLATETLNFSEFFKLAYKNLLYIVEYANKGFAELMDEKDGTHEPHMGLLLTSLKLFREVQSDLNSLTKRHLDFYYQRILQQTPIQPNPIQVLIGVLPKKGAQVLPENSEFNLVFPSKKMVSLKNKFLTELSQAKISDLRTLYKCDYFPFSTGYKMGEVALNAVYDKILFQGVGVQDISFQGETIREFPFTMGEDQSQKGLNQRTMDNSRLGFIVSSSVFLVENGLHFFKIEFELSQDSCTKFNRMLAELLKNKESYMGLTHNHSDQELKSFTYGFLNEAFSVALTTNSGWKTLDFLHVEFNPNDRKLVFKIEPEGEEELPHPYSADLHGELPEGNWPCLRFSLNNSAHYPPYKPLSLLEIVSIEIMTVSKGITTGFEGYNQIGKLDPFNPFLPFGSLPTKDSYLKLYHSIILNKYLSRLAFTFHWMGLPDVRNGFVDYYKTYPEKLSNDSFKSHISVKSDLYVENPSEKSLEQKVNFFETVEKSDGTYLLKTKAVNLNIDLVDLSLLKEPKLSISSKKDLAYLFIQIAEPIPFVFGHEQYAQVFADISYYNSRFPKRQKELPRPAYTPQLDKIEINYSNLTKENLDRKGEENNGSIKLFHLFPFGNRQVYPGNGNATSYLLPQLTGKGNLLIGLTEAVENQFVNLGFKLHPAYFIHTVTQPPKVSWEYLEKNQWIPLGNLMMEDSTRGMLQSGIVKIKLPARLDLANTRFPSGKFWLRVSNSGTADINSRLISVFINATWLTQVAEPTPTPLDLEELYQSLTVLPIENSMLSGVTGPFQLVIPALKKTFEKDRIRVSELMRHRKRGITTWDLERLVLERFPQIGRAMVYGRSDFPLHLVKNSNIQVVVIPRNPLFAQSRTDGFRAPFELLKEIKTYLGSFISPFSRVEVTNPVFEKLKIRAAVKFKQAQQAGYYRDKLERELIEFLSPNPGDFQKQKGFINSIYKAEIQNFIESRSYVDAMTGFSVLQIVEVQGSFKIIDTAESSFKVELLRTISPYAILTSSESHQLEIISNHELKDPELASIGDLSIDTDFIIGRKNN